ncbi:MAG TPA: carboxylating nicotinate-nucleotide diphosphorylase [Chthoniobacterales bacterium]|nr:carboxylating nicotinate-nucleotide diphosphorylase [Chthoniobacterales bacterium]
MSDSSSDPIEIALREDLGEGDITTQFFVRGDLRALGRIVARERAVVAGTETAAEVFRRVNPKLNVEILQPDGTALSGGETILEVRGAAASILTAERVALNFLQRLSGIATLTRQFVEAIGKSRAKILDTRKTTPGLRALEKGAVVAGGGANHRSTLSDMVLVKDNHLSAGAGFSGFVNAIQRIRQERPGIRIEVEADRLEQVRSFLQIEGIDIILLDNMEPTEMREAVAAGKGKVEFEASGGINLKNVRRIAATGVDYISVGALTHSARGIDLSLELTHVGT